MLAKQNATVLINRFKQWPNLHHFLFIFAFTSLILTLIYMVAIIVFSFRLCQANTFKWILLLFLFVPYIISLILYCLPVSAIVAYFHTVFNVPSEYKLLSAVGSATLINILYFSIAYINY
ncbi:MAG: hypothetical protein MHMPM18_003424 [Marteilia pararefringens]